MNTHILRVAVLASLISAPAFAQTGTDLVEVEPIKCWWRTSTSAVRTGEFFDLRLTCAVVETEAARVVPDLSKLDPTVVQLPPFEVTGGTHAGDLVTVGKRFIQYDYRMRLIAEDAFGADVAIPPLEVTYTVESKVAGGESVMGREQSYALPRASDTPSFRMDYHSVPAKTNVLGAKGCGEAGCAGSLPSVMNAISDALGGKHINMPATPERVWEALHS